MRCRFDEGAVEGQAELRVGDGANPRGGRKIQSVVCHDGSDGSMETPIASIVAAPREVR